MTNAFPERLRRLREWRGRYYAAHDEQLRQRAKERYWADPEIARAASQYSKKKRKLFEVKT